MSQRSLHERIAQRVQSAAWSSSALAPSTPHDESQTQNDELPPTPSSFFGNSLNVGPTSQALLSTFARQLKEDYDLDHNSSAEVDKYCGLSLEHRLLLHFVIDVKLKEIAKKRAGSDHYVISNTLKTTLRSNAFLLMMSPKLTCYHGKLAKAVIDATREIGCSELPAIHESGKLQVIEKDLKKHFTDLRYSIKDKVKGSLKKKKRDIASLTQEIIGEKRLSPTLALYRRVSLLRAFAAEKTQDLKPEDKKKDFWVRVDEGIHKWRGLVDGDAEKLLAFFEEVYKDDVATYGDPAKSGVVTIRLSDIPAHQQVIDNHAAKVQYVGSGDDEDDQRPRKRKRAAAIDSGDESEGEDMSFENVDVQTEQPASDVTARVGDSGISS
ncbi:hypothetical protein VKT23_013653 [Stygiomarasmius scandens]|uniref:Uncharacterized protein n=1 Tax=Marasmiellus scandens TaxID=2682957 RepID=A0ABR1J6D2_9AGAR